MCFQVSNLQRFVNECASALSCDNSISTDSLYYNFTNLHPFRTYTFTITAFTHEKGKRKTMTGKTKEDSKLLSCNLSLLQRQNHWLAYFVHFTIIMIYFDTLRTSQIK